MPPRWVVVTVGALVALGVALNVLVHLLLR
jgi:hypothetical protein